MLERTIDRNGRNRRVHHQKSEGDFLGDNGLFLADPNRAFKRSQRHLHPLRLNREREDVAGFADAMGAHAFATRKEN